MSKVTSKLQITLPKAIADRYGIRPGDELKWNPAGESIRIELGSGLSKPAELLTIQEKIDLFDRGSQRLDQIQREGLKRGKRSAESAKRRGWKREHLYNRGFPR